MYKTSQIEKKLLHYMGKALADFDMIQRGDRVLVCLSGGKDSYTLARLLNYLRLRTGQRFTLHAYTLDQSQPGWDDTGLRGWLEAEGIPFTIERRNTYAVVLDKIPEGKTYCSLCSRLRRGHLYRIAREEGCSALVLGHHREDSLETFFMNLFHGAKLAAMPPRLLNDDGDVEVLRPLIYCAEPDLARFAEHMQFPIIPCDLCGSQDGLQRNVTKAMLDDMEKKMPGRKDVMIRALGNIRPSHMLDPKLFDFASLMPGSPAR